MTKVNKPGFTGTKTIANLNLDLEYQGGRLTKVNGQRPEYMGGHELILLAKMLAGDLLGHIVWAERVREAVPNVDLYIPGDDE